MVRLVSSTCLTLSAMLLGGCASGSDRYPSLAVRDAERIQGAFEPVDPAPAPSTPSEPARELLDRLAQILTQANTAHSDFKAAAPRTAQLVRAASGAAIASDRWARAQVALADLDSQRSNAAIPLGDLDLLYADATLAFEQRDAIEATRTAVTLMIAEQDAVLARLRGSLDR